MPEIADGETFLFDVRPEVGTEPIEILKPACGAGSAALGVEGGEAAAREIGFAGLIGEPVPAQANSSLANDSAELIGALISVVIVLRNPFASNEVEVSGLSFSGNPSTACPSVGAVKTVTSDESNAAHGHATRTHNDVEWCSGKPGQAPIMMV